MSIGEEEIELLNLDIEISEESESDSASDSYDSDDDDEGEVGEIGEEERQVDDHPDDVGRMPRPYQHEPEPQQPAAGEQGVAGAGLGYGVGFRGNRDASRLDPRNTDNW